MACRGSGVRVPSAPPERGAATDRSPRLVRCPPVVATGPTPSSRRDASFPQPDAPGCPNPGSGRPNSGSAVRPVEALGEGHGWRRRCTPATRGPTARLFAGPRLGCAVGRVEHDSLGGGRRLRSRLSAAVAQAAVASAAGRPVRVPAARRPGPGVPRRGRPAVFDAQDALTRGWKILPEGYEHPGGAHPSAVPTPRLTDSATTPGLTGQGGNLWRAPGRGRRGSGNRWRRRLLCGRTWGG